MAESPAVNCETEPVWTTEQLTAFAAHAEPLVRVWALDRLEDLGLRGELEELFIGRLEDENAEVVGRALDALSRVGGPEAAEALAECWLRQDLPAFHRYQALSLTAALGQQSAREQLLEHIGQETGCQVGYWVRHDPEDLLEAVWHRWSKGGLPPEPGFLGALIALHPPDMAKPIVRSLGEVADQEDAETLLQRAVEHAGGGRMRFSSSTEQRAPTPAAAGEPPEVWLPEPDSTPESLPELLEEVGQAAEQRDWPAVFRRALKATRQAAARAVEAAPDCETICWNLALAEALSEVPLKRLDSEFRASMACGLLWGLRNAVHIELTLREEPDLRALLDVLLRAGEGQYERVLDCIRERWDETASDPEARAEAIRTIDRWVDEGELRDRVERFWDVSELEEYPAAERVLDLWEQLGTDVPGSELPEDLELVAATALKARPQVLRQRAGDLLRAGGLMSWAALEALRVQNARWAAQLILDAMDSLLCQSAGTEVWEFLYDMGDPAALERALAEWRPGEGSITRCVVILSHLNGSFGELPQQVKAEHQQAEQRWPHGVEQLAELLASDEPAGMLRDRPLAIRARCDECGRTYSYETERVFVLPRIFEEDRENWSSCIVPARIITCKNCGVQDKYQLPPGQNLGLTMALAASRGAEDPEDEPVVLADLRLWDGTPVTRATDAINHLRNHAERNPDNGAAWRGLGNVYQRFGEPAEAEKAWRKAVQVDQTEVEAAYSLADYLWESSPEEAGALAMTAIDRLPNARIAPQQRSNIAWQLVDMLRAVVPHAEPPVAMMAVWSGGQVGEEQVLCVSSADLRRITRWDRLAELLGQNAFEQVGFTPDLPEDPPTQLELLINDSRETPRRISRDGGSTGARASAKVGRNEPCPCGSGRKYKHCCGSPR